MAFTLQIIPGYTFAEADPVTIAKLNRMLSDAHVQIVSGSLETSDIGNLQVTASKLAETLDLSSKDLTLPADRMPKSGAVQLDLGTPDFAGQVGVTTTDGYVWIAKAATANTDWVRTDDRALTSISAAPERVGQIAVVDGMLYFATGTASADDWDTLGMEWLLIPSQGTDETAVPGVADHMKFYAIDNGAQLDLWFRRGTSAPVRLTGVSESGPASEGTPDWDSGWTSVTKDTVYDLTAAGGGFSDTAKFSSTTGVTPASGVLGFVNYRLCKILLKRAGTAAPYCDFLTFSSAFGESYHGCGFWLIEHGGSIPVFDPDTPEGGYDDTGAKLYLRTGVYGILNPADPKVAGICDWDETAGRPLGNGVNACLMRIQLWK